jgi:hypothetical protein
LYFVTTLINSYRWAIILYFEKLSITLGTIYRWYLIGSFFSNFLPADIGSDIGRGIIARNYAGNALKIIRTLFIERLGGLISISLLAWIGLFFFNLPHIAWITLIIGAIFITLSVIIIYCFHRLKFSRWLHELLQYYKNYPALILGVVLLSIPTQFLSALGVWFNLLAVNADISYFITLFLFAIASIATLLPISINGWGLREAVILTIVNNQSYSETNILAGLLLGRALFLLVSSLGMLPFAMAQIFSIVRRVLIKGQSTR